MKRVFTLLVIACLCQAMAFGQNKYEMVIEKTDGTEVVIPVDDIVKTTFREKSSADGEGTTPDNLSLAGHTWCYGSSEDDALGDLKNIEGYKFRTDGTCTYFAIYNNGTGKVTKNGTYTFENDILTIITNKTNRYNVSILGNCMTWTGDDDETLYTREGFTIDLGDNDGNSPSSNVNLQQLFGKWICCYQQWTESGDVWDRNYTTDEYYIELLPQYTGTICSGKDELMEWRAIGGRTYTWTLSGDYIKIIKDTGSLTTWEIVSLTDTELTLRWVGGEYGNYVIIAKFKKDGFSGDGESNSSSDPEGTIITDRKSNTWFYPFDDIEYGFYRDKNVFLSQGEQLQIVHYGEVNGLSDITTIPSTGWVQQFGQFVGHGYVARYSDARSGYHYYARIYIAEQIGQGSTANISYRIKYQPFFMPEGFDFIPNGTYAEIDEEGNYVENDYYLFEANGSNITWKHYADGQKESNSVVQGSILTDLSYFYTIKDNKIALSSDKGTEVVSYSRDGRVLSIGGKSYMKLAQIIDVIKE